MRASEIRGKILAFLKHIYPDSVDEQIIISVYYQYYRHKQIKEALEYLVDKGYIERIEKTHPYKDGEKIRIYKILPDGVDIVDGIREDIGVMRVDW